jgi:hypothetical protein
MRRSLWLAPCAVATIVAVVPLPAGWVETWYSGAAYLALQRRLTSWSNAIPIAVTDLLLAALGVAAAAGLRRWIRVSKSPGRWRALPRVALGVATIASAVYLLFMATWGLNYRREPLRMRLDFDAARVTPGAVAEFTSGVVERVNALHGRAHAEAWPDWESLPVTLGPSFLRVQRELADVEPAVPGLPKRSVLTFYFERAGVSGMTDPFALEVVVDRSQLPFERPFVAAHEWAHLAGYAGEEEANFIGWLVCLQGPTGAQYSGNLALLLSLLGAMPAAERQAFVDAIAPGPRRDIQAIQNRSARIWRWLQRPAWWVYDRYLRANRVESGIRSYGAALSLIVGTRFGAGGVPLRRQKIADRR